MPLPYSRQLHFAVGVRLDLMSGEQSRHDTAMKTAFRKAILPAEVRSLVIFDHKAFPKADWFDAKDWARCESWWLIVNGIKLGCCAFERDADFQERYDPDIRGRSGSLYIASTGILPRFRGRGFGDLMKRWQISYARYHGFQRIVTNTRESNLAMIRLNRKYGFDVIRTSPGYYENPPERVVVMELQLNKTRQRSR
jgi:ribosomal protein S18 acetylase RimI-like enzyme